jgi:hypothetical protein
MLEGGTILLQSVIVNITSYKYDFVFAHREQTLHNR